tara:strand:- start:260 stop:2569 length:2310 start_codon:yes stop_codon:yes gene_type:complete
MGLLGGASLPLLLMLLVFQPGCDTICVGPNCRQQPDDTESDPDTQQGDDDDSADAAVSSTQSPDERWPEDSSPRSCAVIREHLAPTGVAQVQLAGEFSDWQPLEMEGPDAQGWWSIELGELAPGNYAYKYLYDGAWEAGPPPWSLGHWSDGIENRNLRVADCSSPLLRVLSGSATPSGELELRVQFLAAADGASLDMGGLEVMVGELPTEASWDPSSGQLTVAATGLPSGKHTVRLSVVDAAGRAAENSPLFVPLWVEDEPFRWAEGLMYFVFTDRFRDGDWEQDPLLPATPGVAWRADYQGGNFLGVIHALQEDYFADLGVNVLWISPAQENPEGAYLGIDGVNLFSGYHGYWPVSARGVEERFGDSSAVAKDRLHELVREAHARGVRVVFDLVLNHVHLEHEYLVEHPEWLSDGCVCGTSGCDWDARVLDCWFTDYLPDLNYRNHAIVERVVDDVLWWVREFDVDGLRVDAAKHLDHVIMRTLRSRLEQHGSAPVGAPIHLVGETFSGASEHELLMDYVGDYELHGQFDFPLYWSIRSTFAGDGSMAALEQAMQTSWSAFEGAIMSPFLGNHDVPRFVTEAAGNGMGPWGSTPDLLADGADQVTRWDLVNRLSMAFVFTLTQPGLPLLYYGDEIGLAGDGDPDNRRWMNFAPYLSANQQELLDRVRAIGTARKESAALRGGQVEVLWVDEELLVYSLTATSGEVAVVAMNKGWGTRTEVIPAPALEDLGVAQLQGLLQPNRQWSVGPQGLALALGSWEYAVLSSVQP